MIDLRKLAEITMDLIIKTPGDRHEPDLVDHVYSALLKVQEKTRREDIKVADNYCTELNEARPYFDSNAFMASGVAIVIDKIYSLLESEVLGKDKKEV